MGTQDRDWHREWWAKKERYVERSDFRLPAAVVERRNARRVLRRRVMLALMLIAVVGLVYFARQPGVDLRRDTTSFLLRCLKTTIKAIQ